MHKMKRKITSMHFGPKNETDVLKHQGMPCCVLYYQSDLAF